ncbi:MULTISPECIES: DUF1302 domain-containing protein [Burkholderia]|uniref:DUF1302 domain-containing protein n=1 Tax=Burkholderia TaxID=32008 RepID=UPI000B7A1F80|nr:MULTISPECIES: DUF1302 family protein [Burkholderia]MBY4724236.1 DUF1302 domain-containing protein [Burkholderia contaminans]MCI3974834.1 DUF1302 domain-containing protein [Burkholderia sp. HI4860]MDN7789765.1 DUF1302 family protein [Burkholderia contaminans]OXI92941.1 arylsulfatase [Burkholderia sp. AU33647]
MATTSSLQPRSSVVRVRAAIAALVAVGCGSAHAFTFTIGNVEGSFDSTISAGVGIRTASPSSNLVSPTYNVATGTQTGGGRLGQLSGLSDQGDINYGKGDPFTSYLKGNHELVLKMPSQGLTFMARGTWQYDYSGTRTTGATSGQDLFYNPSPNLSGGLPSDAEKNIRFKPRLLDLWVSKQFNVGDQIARVRVGNQVVSWGESIWEVGGVNATNAIDVNRASQPGAQVKEIILPAPIVSVASGVGHGVNVEGYYQSNWNQNYLPPVGSYWSNQIVGPGNNAYGVATVHPKNGGQYGFSIRYQPAGTDLNLGFYTIAYHDKFPQVSLSSTGGTVFRFPEDRHMIGVSANFPVGDWAIGTELSYRPRDAVPLNPASGCVAQGGNCWVDEKRFQWHLTTLYSLQPGNSAAFLKLLGAQTATLTTETVIIAYPGLHKSYGGSPISPGALLWGNEFNDLFATGALNTPGSAQGTKYSGGIDVDFNWVYDGTVIPGWQVNPGIFVRYGLFGNTPNVNAQFMRGVTAMNLYVNFVQNPANWQVGLNYTRFMGPTNPLANPLRDRDFVAIVASRNF